MRNPVQSESGLVQGLPRWGRSVTVFWGVPDAASPVGEPRRRPPRPPAPWDGLRRAGLAATADPGGRGLPHQSACSPDARTVMEAGDGFGPVPVTDPAGS